jgi:hypothetical protein
VAEAASGVEEAACAVEEVAGIGDAGGAVATAGWHPAITDMITRADGIAQIERKIPWCFIGILLYLA